MILIKDRHLFKLFISFLSAFSGNMILIKDRHTHTVIHTDISFLGNMILIKDRHSYVSSSAQ